MELIVGGRQSGRTTRLVNEMVRAYQEQESVALMVMDERERARVLSLFLYHQSIKGTDVDFTRWVERSIATPDRHRKNAVDRIHVDNLDIVLPRLLGAPVGMVSMLPPEAGVFL